VKPISCGPVPDRGRSARLLARWAAASPGLAGVCTGWAHLPPLQAASTCPAITGC